MQCYPDYYLKGLVETDLHSMSCIVPNAAPIHPVIRPLGELIDTVRQYGANRTDLLHLLTPPI